MALGRVFEQRSACWPKRSGSFWPVPQHTPRLSIAFPSFRPACHPSPNLAEIEPFGHTNTSKSHPYDGKLRRITGDPMRRREFVTIVGGAATVWPLPLGPTRVDLDVVPRTK